MPFPWGKSSFKSTSNKEIKENGANGAQSLLLSSSKSLPSDLSASSASKRKTTERARKKLVQGPVSSPTPVRQPSNFTQANTWHPLPLPCSPSSLNRADLADGVSRNSRAHVNSELLFRLPSPSEVKLRSAPSEVKLRSDARDGDGATSGYGSGSTSSYNSLSSTDMPDLQSGHRESTLVQGLKSESETEQSKRHNDFSVLQGAFISNCIVSPGRKNLLPSGSPVVEKSIPPETPKTKSGAGKTARHSQEYQGNAALSSTSTSLLSSPRQSPRRDHYTGQSCPSPPVAFRNSGHMMGVTMAHSSSRSPKSPHNVPLGDFSELNFGKPGRVCQECLLLPCPTIPRIRTGANSSVPSSVASPKHPAASGFCLDSATSSLEGSSTRHPLSMPASRPSEQSPFMSPPIPSSPRSLQSHGLSRSENTVNCTSQWQKGKLLGSGTFGNVYKGFSDSGTFCAMKEVLVSDDPRSKESVKQLSQEIQTLSHLRHPNIVQYLGSEIFEDRLYIYLEYVSGGSIHNMLQEYGRFKEPVIRRYTRQILCGLAYLHSMRTVHRDIKGANILVDTNGEVKLADFGMAKHINAHAMPLSFKGSPYWMAPEVFKSTNGYEYPVDIWSLGCTIIEMATAKPPWSQYEGVAALFKIGNSKEVPTIPESLSKEGQEFLRLCLQRDPMDRPSAMELLEHPFARVPSDVGLETNQSLDCTASNAIATYSPHASSFEVGQPRSPSQNMVPPSSEFAHPQMGQTSPLASPCNSPRLPQRISYQKYGGFSPSPISSPRIGSGSSTPRSRGYGTQPFLMVGVQSTVRSFAENYGDVSRRPPDKAFVGSSGRYGGLDGEGRDTSGNIRSAYASEHKPSNGMYWLA